MNSPSAPFREWLRSVNEMSSESGKTAHAIVLMSGGLDSVVLLDVLARAAALNDGPLEDEAVHAI